MLFFPPPFPIGISLTILILDKSLREVIPPALLKTSEIVVIFSFDLFMIKSEFVRELSIISSFLIKLSSPWFESRSISEFRLLSKEIN